MPIKSAAGVSGGGGGASVLDDLLDVTISAPAVNQLLKYNGAQWVNSLYAHNLLTGLSADDHSQYLLLVGRAGGQLIQTVNSGDIAVKIRAFTAANQAVLQIQDGNGDRLLEFVRNDNAGGGSIGSINFLTNAGKDSGGFVTFLNGPTYSQYIQQIYLASPDAFYTQVNKNTTKFVLRNTSAAGTPTICLSPTDLGRFGINTENPGFTFDVWYGGASIFSVSNAGDVLAHNLTLSGNFKAASLIVNISSVDQLQITSDGAGNNFIDTVNNIKYRDAFGGGVTFALLTRLGKLRLGDGSLPIQRLELVAGTNTIAPLLISTGSVVLTAPVRGAIESDDARLYFTIAGPTRKTIAYTDDIPASSAPSFSRTFMMMGA